MTLQEILPKQCFTYDGADRVYYDDTGFSESKRHFHSYIGGELFRSSDCLFPKDKDFYYCTVHGEKLPREHVEEMIKMKKEIKELKKRIHCTFQPMSVYFNNSNSGVSNENNK